MSYNTGNPVPSKDPRDLVDNAENLDRAVNGDEPTWTDRLGRERKSWAGIEQDFSDFLSSSGFEPVHLVYQDGVELTVDRPTQLIDYNGSVYRVKMPSDFPVSLSGTWATDSALLVDIGDQSLRQELASPSGAAMVGWERQTLGDAIKTAHAMLDAQAVNVWEFAVGTVTSDFDWTTAIQAAIDYCAGIGGGIVHLPPQVQRYKITPQSDGAALKMRAGVILMGAGRASNLHLVTASDEQPNTSVNWDAVLFGGAEVTDAGIIRVKVSHEGGARNNAASVAVRGGASRIEIAHNILDDSIASAVVIEGSVAAPIKTDCRVRQNLIRNSRRHGVYLSGATHNRVADNVIVTTRLESFVVRNAHDNDIEHNTVVGDGVSYPLHGLALAAPPGGTVYTNERVNVRHNKFISIPNAALYGQGTGARLKDSDWSDNDIWAMCGADTISHALMIYRASGCQFNDNKIYGGRNRGIMLYGCSDNEVLRNKLVDTNEAGAPVGTLFLGGYQEPQESTTTYSLRNRIQHNEILDTRSPAKHYYGIQLLEGCDWNTVGPNRIEGVSGAACHAPDWSKQVTGDNVESFTWHCNDLPAGSTSETPASAAGNVSIYPISEQGSLRSLALFVPQIVTAGTITATLYLNGSPVGSATLTGDGATKLAATYFAPEVRKVAAGDVLTVLISANSIAIEQSSADCLIRVATGK